MAGEAVLCFEATDAGVVLLSRHATLAACSAALPDGAYTTLRTYGGRRLLRLERHLQRLLDSIRLQGRVERIEEATARRAIVTALDATRWPESRLRITFAPPRLFVAIEPFRPLPAFLYQAGVACVTLALHRDNPQAKDTRFIAAAQDAYARLPRDVEEGLLVEDGRLLEGLSSNFFAVVDGVLRTEEADALSGVTRSLVLELAEGLLPVDRRAVQQSELPRTSEAFLTSVSREVLPVVRIDERPVAAGEVGPWTRAILRRFAALVAREARPV